MTTEVIVGDSIPKPNPPASTSKPSGGDLDPNPNNAIELLDKLEQSNPETRATFEAFIASISRTVGSGISSLYPKFTPEHITIFLNGIQEDDNNRASMIRRRQWMSFVLALIGIIVFVGLILILKKDDQALLEEIIKIAMLFGGGIGAGIGLNSRRQ